MSGRPVASQRPSYQSHQSHQSQQSHHSISSSHTAASASTSAHPANQSQSQSQIKNQSKTMDDSTSARTPTRERALEKERMWTPHAPLPAVKGTIGGIDSPRRRHFHSPSITHTPRMSPAPGTSPLPDQQHHANDESRSDHQHTEQQVQDQPSSPSRVPNPNAPVFRADPTVKTTFDHTPFDPQDRETLKSMFMV